MIIVLRLVWAFFFIDGKILVSEGQLIGKAFFFCKNNRLKLVIFKTTRCHTLIAVYKAGRKKVSICNIICTIGYLLHKVCNLVVFKTTGVL